jgi:hypothetical protein
MMLAASSPEEYKAKAALFSRLDGPIAQQRPTIIAGDWLLL